MHIVGDIIRFGASTRTYVFKNEDASADKHNKDEQGNPTEVVDDALMKQLPMSFGTTQKRSEAPSDNAAAARKKVQ
jgi:hypothetical protein